VGKWETLTGEGGFGICGGLVVFAMMGVGERDRVVRRIVMSFVCGWRSEVEGGRERRRERCGR